MEERPNYFAIIPANVRYDDELKAIEKLLYGEITTLTHKTGECWASNNYFAKLYNIYPTTISKYLNHLKNKGYIDIKMEYVENSKEIDKRKICIAQMNNTYCLNEQEGYSQTNKGGIACMSKDNNTSINNTSINNIKEIYKERFEEFYKSYPKHVKKALVEKWFEKNKPDEDLFNTIMEQLESNGAIENLNEDLLSEL